LSTWWCLIRRQVGTESSARFAAQTIVFVDDEADDDVDDFCRLPLLIEAAFVVLLLLLLPRFDEPAISRRASSCRQPCHVLCFQKCYITLSMMDYALNETPHHKT
jgi:hypothetical protein